MASMPRRLRIQYPGAIYHVMSRGNARQKIVRDNEDRDRVIASSSWESVLSNKPAAL